MSRPADEAQLPGSIAAVFCIQPGECTAARDVHTRFLAAYGLSATQVPLLRYAFAAGFVDIT